jgi:hypothetical protein
MRHAHQMHAREMHVREVHAHETYILQMHAHQIYQVANIPVFCSLKKEIYRCRALPRRSDGVELKYCTLTSIAVARSRKGKFEAEHVELPRATTSPAESILRLTFASRR